MARKNQQWMTTLGLEDDIEIHGWGWWARPGIDRQLGVKAPGWTQLVKSGYRQSAPPGIEEDYARRLDGIIAAMPERYRRTLIGLYVYRMGVNRLAAAYGETKHSIAQDRDAALNMIYGALNLGG